MELWEAPQQTRFVELQLVRKLLISRQSKNTKTPDRYQGDFIDLCSPSGIADSGVTEEISQNWSVKHEFESIDCNTGTPSWYKLEKWFWHYWTLRNKLVHLDEDDATLLKQVYQIMYPEREIELANLTETMHKFSSIKIWSTTFGSKMQPRGIRSSKILALWPADNGQVLKDIFFMSAGTVRYYFKHSIQVGDEHLTHCFACMRWYIPHEQSVSLHGNPLRVCKTISI